MTKKTDGISQQTEDSIVNRICERLIEKNLYGGVMKDLEKKGQRDLVEGSLERHAARQRAAGKKGW